MGANLCYRLRHRTPAACMRLIQIHASCRCTFYCHLTPSLLRKKWMSPNCTRCRSLWGSWGSRPLAEATLYVSLTAEDLWGWIYNDLKNLLKKKKLKTASAGSEGVEFPFLRCSLTCSFDLVCWSFPLPSRCLMRSDLSREQKILRQTSATVGPHTAVRRPTVADVRPRTVAYWIADL